MKDRVKQIKAPKRGGFHLGILIFVLAGGFSGCTWHNVEQLKEEQPLCFETEVLPIFVSYCTTTGCHNPTDHAEDYDFTQYNGIRQGVRPGRAGDSKVIEVMREGGDDRMPPAGQPQPSAEQIAMIEEWINEGAENTQNCASAGCDTSVVATYSGDIQPMVQTFCAGCHGSGNPGGGLDLSSYAVVKQNAVNGRIQGAITGDPSYARMPPNGAMLPPCYAVKINQWVAAGAQNN
jgi:hypothetical protein